LFPLHAWYAAARDREVGRDLQARALCGRPLEASSARVSAIAT